MGTSQLVGRSVAILGLVGALEMEASIPYLPWLKIARRTEDLSHFIHWSRCFLTAFLHCQ